MPASPTISDPKTENQLSTKLSEIKGKSLNTETQQKAQNLGLGFIKLTSKIIPESILILIPKKIAQANNVVVYEKDQTSIKIAAVDPVSEEVKKIVNNLEKKFNIPIKISFTTQASIEKALKQYENITKKSRINKIEIDGQAIESLSREIEDYRAIGDKIHQVSLTEFLNLLFAAALKINASDVHIQPEASSVKVRFRIDGVLHKIFDLTHDEFLQIKKRLKLISKLKINIEDRPQDGGFSITVKNNQIDLRVSSLPSNFGENIVIRILNTEAVELEFKKLGIHKQMLNILKSEIKKPNGMIIACGPTGSGKTTTLYTILKELNTEGQQIVTLENPIEYKLEGIVQTSIKDEAGFAENLKAVLRQDPDIIMVGEIRDLSTAETAINAALTGHLVISTIHTNSAIGAIPRFSAMGAKPFLLAPSLNLIIGQRLVRRVCKYCKVPFKTHAETMNKVKKELANLPTVYKKELNLNKLVFYQGHSCNKCGGLGYKGRIGIYEMLHITEYIKAAIQKGNTTEQELKKLANKQGMITMIQDGLLKALAGITTVEEVFRVAE